MRHTKITRMWYRKWIRRYQGSMRDLGSYCIKFHTAHKVQRSSFVLKSKKKQCISCHSLELSQWSLSALLEATKAKRVALLLQSMACLCSILACSIKYQLTDCKLWFEVGGRIWPRMGHKFGRGFRSWNEVDNEPPELGTRNGTSFSCSWKKPMS